MFGHLEIGNSPEPIYPVWFEKIEFNKTTILMNIQWNAVQSMIINLKALIFNPPNYSWN